MNAIDVLRSNLDSWNRHDADAVVAAFAEGGLYIHPALPEPATGPAIGDFVRAVSTWCPDFSLDLISIGDTGERVVLEWLFHGTNTGPAADGTPPPASKLAFQASTLRKWRATKSAPNGSILIC